MEQVNHNGNRPPGQMVTQSVLPNKVGTCGRRRSKNTILCLNYFSCDTSGAATCHIATEFTPCGETVVWSFNLCCLPEQVMPQWLRDKWLPSGHHRIRGIRILDFIIEIVSLTRCTRRRSRNTVWCLHLFWWWWQWHRYHNGPGTNGYPDGISSRLTITVTGTRDKWLPSRHIEQINNHGIRPRDNSNGFPVRITNRLTITVSVQFESLIPLLKLSA